MIVSSVSIARAISSGSPSRWWISGSIVASGLGLERGQRVEVDRDRAGARRDRGAVRANVVGEAHGRRLVAALEHVQVLHAQQPGRARTGAGDQFGRMRVSSHSGVK